METTLITLTGTDSDIDKLTAAAKVLDEGGLVAFPTETVYGIGCKAAPAAIARLDKVKDRVADKRYTLHIPDKSVVCKYVPAIPPRAQKLIDAAWPGPVTVVFELDAKAIETQRGSFDGGTLDILYRDNTIGIRCPDDPTARELLSLTSEPIVAPSANIGDQKPAISAKEVMSRFDGKIDIILEGTGSPCRCKDSSTVVKVTAEGLDILRKGVYSAEQIAQMSLIRILFVCTGNTCRSPMAEFFCRKYISKKFNCDIDSLADIGYKIASAGVMDLSGAPASSEVVDICRQMGVDASAHKSRPLTKGDICGSDYIFAMSAGHREAVVRICPEAAEKCLLLDENSDIDDPIGQGLDVYRRCAAHIEKALKTRMSGIFK